MTVKSNHAIALVLVLFGSHWLYLMVCNYLTNIANKQGICVGLSSISSSNNYSETKCGIGFGLYQASLFSN